jgi:hypothetical protein
MRAGAFDRVQWCSTRCHDEVVEVYQAQPVKQIKQRRWEPDTCIRLICNSAGTLLSTGQSCLPVKCTSSRVGHDPGQSQCLSQTLRCQAAEAEVVREV